MLTVSLEYLRFSGFYLQGHRDLAPAPLHIVLGQFRLACNVDVVFPHVISAGVWLLRGDSHVLAERGMGGVMEGSIKAPELPS